MSEKNLQNGHSKFKSKITTYPVIKFPKEEDSLSEISKISKAASDGSKGLCCPDTGNPTYKRNRRLQLAQMIILPFIPILALIVQTTLSLQYLLQYRNDIEDVETQASKIF